MTVIDIPSLGLSDLLTDGTNTDKLGDDLVERGHRQIGAGSFATVYDVPHRPDLAIRVSGGLDGFLEYAIRSKADRPPSEAVPALHVVHDIGFVRQGVVYLLERLRPLTSAEAEIVTGVFSGRGAPPTPAWQANIDCIERLSTWLDRKAGTAGETALDWRLPNLMMRGETLVFADPFGDSVGPRLRALMALEKRSPAPFPSLLDSFHRFRRPAAATTIVSRTPASSQAAPEIEAPVP